MKVAFIGGGSLRLLPLLRGIMGNTPQAFANSELRFIDLKRDRAEAVAAMVKASPEFSKVDSCTISCPANTDEGLKDIDVLYLTMAARREPEETQALFLAHEYGLHASDQLTPNGAFLSMRLGPVILNLARKLEVLSPNALMLIFPNPVAVYSAMVNTFTKIRAIGICGGFNNHRWDLTRALLGRHEFDPKWNVVAAGINHLSFILRGDYMGEDLYSSLCPRIYGPDPAPCKIGELGGWVLYESYRRYGKMIFSSELDGFAHIFPDFAHEWRAKRLASLQPFDPASYGKAWANEMEQRFSDFMKNAENAADFDWDNPPDPELYQKSITDISLPIFKALAKIEPMRIVATRPNNGAVAGFPDKMAMEYTMDIFGSEITPVADQYVPAPFHGLCASLGEFQTLLAQALAERNPELFAFALESYPVQQFTNKRREFFCRMFDLYRDIDPEMQKARKFFE